MNTVMRAQAAAHLLGLHGLELRLELLYALLAVAGQLVGLLHDGGKLLVHLGDLV